MKNFGGGDLENNIISFNEARDKVNQRKSILCAACDDLQQIGDLSIIETHWYEKPFGCSEGDCWHAGELQFVCLCCESRNRILFDNYDVPYPDRGKYEFNPELQFKRNYMSLFNEVISEFNNDYSSSGIINYYVDQNRSLFGLVLKKD